MVSPDWLKGSRHRGKRGPSHHKLRRSYSNAIGTHAIFPSVRSHLHSKFPRWRRPPVPTHRARPMNPPPSSPACQARISCAAPRTFVRDDPTPRSARLRTAQRDASHTLPLGARTPPSAHRRSDDADLSDSAGRAKRASRRNKYSGIKPRIGEPSSPATERATDHAQRNPHLAFFLPSGFSGRVRPCPRLVRLQLSPDLSARVRALSAFRFIRLVALVRLQVSPDLSGRVRTLSAFTVVADTPSSAPLGDGAAIPDRAPASDAAPPCACQRCGSRSPHRIPTPRAAARAATPPDRCAE